MAKGGVQLEDKGQMIWGSSTESSRMECIEASSHRTLLSPENTQSHSHNQVATDWFEVGNSDYRDHPGEHGAVPAATTRRSGLLTIEVQRIAMLHSMEAQSSIGLRSTDPAILALGTAAVDHVAKVLTGREHVVSFAGRSQYSPDGGGVSACGLAALNCARVVLGKERDGMRGEQILEELMKQDTVEVSRNPVPTASSLLIRSPPRP